jgi:hypothetical protein
MRFRRVLSLIVTVGLILNHSQISFSAVTPKAGAACSKVGKKQNFAGKTFTCVKKGKKLVWNQGVAIAKPAPVISPTPSVSASPVPSPTPSPTPTPNVSNTPTPSPTPTPEITPTPTSFDDLYESRKGISLAAWSKLSQTLDTNSARTSSIDIYTGTNTVTFFDDYPKIVGLVSRAFPKQALPEKVIVIRYQYPDLTWAENLLQQKISANDYMWLQRNEGNQPTASNCDVSTRNCMGAKQQTTVSGIALILQGVANSINSYDPTGKARFASGMLEVHEYFHSLQRIPIMNRGVNVWPHAWFREGSAEWVQNAVVNYKDFKSYRDFMKADCGPSCSRMTEQQIKEFLDSANENFLPAKFDQFLNYSLGSFVIEALVALKGQESLIDMYAAMGRKLTFDEAFKEIYGAEWSKAKAILAKTVYANINEL